MNIAVVGGAGAMGSALGALLFEAGNNVTLVDVGRGAVDVINADGIRIEEKSGAARTVHVPATTDPATVGTADLMIVFVKCYHTESAVKGAAPLIGPGTVVLSLQNGWGNAPRIASLVGQEKVLAGVTYHSANVLEPGRILHSGRGQTFLGELKGGLSERATRVADVFNRAGIETTATDAVLPEIWKKLALNVCTLPTSALLRFPAHLLVEHDGTMDLMRALLAETADVARAQGIALDEAERWEGITSLLRRAVGGKSSMLQDVEKGRRTEIDVINGAIVEAGKRCGVPTPYNNAMVWMVKALEETFPA
jgi:2-dehydropantoate 2-reductase